VEQAEPDSGVTLAELLTAFSLATDLGLGQPMEHLCQHGQFGGGGTTPRVVAMLIGQQRRGQNSPMCSHLAVVDLTGVEHPDQVGSRHVQQVGRLLGSQLRVRRHHRDGVPVGHVRQGSREQLNCRPGHDELTSVIVSQPDRGRAIGMRPQVRARLYTSVFDLPVAAMT
jgi:hypothetical protein